MGKIPVLAVVVLLVLVLQVAVPLTALVLPGKPHRLGWQMYSGLGAGAIVVTDIGGKTIDVLWDDILAKGWRPELDWSRHLPEMLCARLGQEQITVAIGDEKRTLSC